MSRAFFLLFLVLLASCSGAEEAVPLFPCSAKLKEPYGITSHVSRNGWDYSYRDSVFFVSRLLLNDFVRFDIDFDERGISLEKSLVYDSVYKASQEHGVQLLGIVEAFRAKDAWREDRAFLRFTKEMAGLYNDKVFFWEILNEVNHAVKSAKDGAAMYTTMLKDVYSLLKETNAGNYVLLGGLGEVDDDFLVELSKNNAFEYFDIMNFHTYHEPEKFPLLFKKIRRVMDDFRWRKPVWITETGMHSATDDGRNISKRVLEERQAQCVARAFLISFAYGIDKVFWYNLRSFERTENNMEDHFGLVHKNFSPKPSFYAYKTLTTMCPSNSTRPKLFKNGNLYLSSWVKPNGIKVWAMWNASGQKKIRLSIVGSYNAYDYIGNSVALTDEMVLATPGVLYIEGASSVEFVN